MCLRNCRRKQYKGGLLNHTCEGKNSIQTLECIKKDYKSNHFVTTDKWALDPAEMGDATPCKYWERCFEGQINQGTCADGHLFSEVLRECVPEGDPTLPDSCYSDPCRSYGMPICGDGYECVNPTNCQGLDVTSGGNCIVECKPLTPPPSHECNAGCLPEAECVQEIQCQEVQNITDFHDFFYLYEEKLN